MIYSHSLLLIAATLATVLAGEPRQCPIDSPLSCHVEDTVRDSCCVIADGLLLQTQFWDARPAIGPDNSWTIHGLWPDKCKGGYPTNCDRDREHRNITEILEREGAEDLLEYMEEYWKPNRGSDNSFWVHEWNKHGTCINTLEPHCYRGYQHTEEVVDYFETVVGLFKDLPTYDWLAEHGIVPSHDRDYPFKAIEKILRRKHGKEVTIKCKGRELNEVWYYFNVRGSLQTGEFVPAAAHQGSKCPEYVRYPPKVSRRSRKFGSHKYPDGLEEGEQDQIEL